jgi:ketosteroid isomerase-like protein
MTSRMLLASVALCAAAAPALAAEGPAAQLREVFRAHETAFNAHDVQGVMKLYAPGDSTVVLGTGPGERWVGSAEIADAYRHFFADFDAGTLKRNCAWELPGVSGDVGWLSAMCSYQDSLKGVKREYSLNISVVLQKTDGTWQVCAMHFSNLTGPMTQAGEPK